MLHILAAPDKNMDDVVAGKSLVPEHLVPQSSEETPKDTTLAVLSRSLYLHFLWPKAGATVPYNEK